MDVTWIAVNNNVRSPVAAEPNRNCSLRTCLQTRGIVRHMQQSSLGIVNIPGQGNDIGAGGAALHGEETTRTKQVGVESRKRGGTWVRSCEFVSANPIAGPA